MNPAPYSPTENVTPREVYGRTFTAFTDLEPISTILPRVMRDLGIPWSDTAERVDASQGEFYRETLPAMTGRIGEEADFRFHRVYSACSIIAHGTLDTP